jgi:hypothetical protein
VLYYSVISRANDTLKTIYFEGYTPKKTDLNPSAQNDTISLKAREKINLLLVEDSSADEFLIRKILETCPYDFEIYCIHSGDEAIHYLKNIQELHLLQN